MHPPTIFAVVHYLLALMAIDGVIDLVVSSMLLRGVTVGLVVQHVAFVDRQSVHTVAIQFQFQWSVLDHKHIGG